MGYRLLGAHLNNTVSQLPEAIKDWKPSLVVLLDHSDVWHDVKADTPKSIFVGRVYQEFEPDFNEPDLDPIAAARDNCDKILPWAERMGQTYDYWQGINEPILASAEAMKRCAAFDAERARIMHEHGFRVVVGSFSVGNPRLPLWKEFLPALEAARQYDGALALHEYAWPTLDRESPWYLLRHRKVYDGEPKHNWQGLPQHLKALPLLITECGLDGLIEKSSRPRGWRALYESNPREYLRQLAWYDAQLLKDAYVVGAALYCLATPDALWKSYDLWPDLVRRLAGQADPIYRLSDPQPPLQPDPKPPEPVLREKIVWKMKVLYRQGPRILAGSLPQAGIRVKITDPWGNASTVISGSKSEHGPGGFEILAPHAGLYQVSFQNKAFQVEVREQVTVATFERKRVPLPPEPPREPAQPEKPEQPTQPLEPEIPDLPTLPSDRDERLRLALARMDRIIHRLRLHLFGSIGSAIMETGGAIVLTPTTREENRVRTLPDDPRYALILSHLGGLEPGQQKLMPPWPDEGAGIL